MLLGMPDTVALKIININIDSIQAVKEKCNTNIGNAGKSSRTQEVAVGEKGCTNMKADSKVDTNINSHNTNINVNSLTNYFLFFTKCRSRQKEKHRADAKNTQRIWQCV